jgi:PilZ domain
MINDRRRTPRYGFVASAELSQHGTQLRVASRVSELGLHGCYLNMMDPFPTGTLVRLKIHAGDMAFESKGRIVYHTPNDGAGVAFLEVEPKEESILKHWLKEAAER